MMQETTIVLIVAAAVIVGVLIWVGLVQRRSVRLRQRFGPEYEEVVHSVGDKRKAEAELDARQRRVEKLHIRSLTDAELDRYHDAWRRLQARFVENPKA